MRTREEIEMGEGKAFSSRKEQLFLEVLLDIRDELVLLNEKADYIRGDIGRIQGV